MKYFNTNADVNLASLHIISVPLGSELPGPTTILFNRSIRVLMPRISRMSINFDCSDSYYETLKARQDRTVKNNNAF